MDFYIFVFFYCISMDIWIFAYRYRRGLGYGDIEILGFLLFCLVVFLDWDLLCFVLNLFYGNVSKYMIK